MPLIKKPGSNLKKKAVRLRLSTARIRIFLWQPAAEKPVSGFCFVADFEDEAISFYIQDKVELGTRVQLAFDSEQGAAYKARVMWCNPYEISPGSGAKNPAPFRVGIKIRFSSEAERQRYLTYVEQVRQKTTSIKPGMKF